MKRGRAGITRVEKRCPLCIRSLKRGLLWIGGGDYAECPDCEGTGIFVSYRERMPPPPTRVFLLESKGR